MRGKSIDRHPPREKLMEQRVTGELRRALQELRRAQSNVTLAWIAEQMPIKLDADRVHYLAGFRRAEWSRGGDWLYATALA